jgi:hemoglobin/transferrin/lactoferrin receptor protein
MHLHRLAAAIACAVVFPVHAETAAAPTPEIYDELDRIIVSATLSAKAVKDVAGESSVILREEMDRQLVQDLRDLMRYEPGVSVLGRGRFGIGSIAIRGLDGNRVRIEVDGVGAPDAFSIGSFSNAGRDFVDLDNLKRVEIVRGSASALYGSDALGGVVSFVTKDPGDYFADARDGTYFGLKGLYDSADRQSSESLTAAMRSGDHGLMAVYTHRDGHAINNKGTVDSRDGRRTRPDPIDTSSDALLAKYVHTSGERVERVTLDASRSTSQTNSLSSLGDRAVGPTQVRVSRMDADDTKERGRLSFEQELPLSAGFADRLDWRVFVQTAKTQQDTFEDRASLVGGAAVRPVSRYRRFDYEQRESGIEAVARKAIEGTSVRHDIAYGVEYTGGRIREERDGFQRDLTTGAITNVVSPDVFPVRDFPLTDTTSYAVFAQDDIAFADGRFHLIPGVRYDSFSIDPRTDPVFAADNPGVAPVDLDADHVSPKLAAIWQFTDALSVYAQYAAGFRAPPYSDVNVGFTNFQQGYTALPNPNLKPETSRGVEIGLRGSGEIGYFSVAAYRNRYRDFIESLAFIGTDPATGLMLFQSRNLNRVDIRGAEARGGLHLSAFAPALDGWEVRTSLAWAKGDDRTAGTPLTSVDPAKAVVGIAYDAERWGAELAGTFVARKNRLAAAATGAQPFRAPGYSTLDLYVHVTPLDNLEVYAAATNLTDRHYWQWGDVRGFTASPTIDRYSMPGRAASVGFKLSFQ